MIKVIHNVETDIREEIELTADEIAALEAEAEADALLKAEADALLKAEADAKAALLERLGITEDEAKLLLS